MIIKAKKLHPDAILPTKAHPETDAGWDLYSLSDRTLGGGFTTHTIDTGIALELPVGYYAQIFGRSGLADNEGVIAHPGVVDSSYRGMVRVILYCIDPEASYRVRKGDKIAQFVLLPVPQVAIEEVDELSPSERNEAGFGSSGR